jgi:thymidylate kinase
MKIAIFEGIATSGKTSVIKFLKKSVEQTDLNYIVVKEEKTLMPIVENIDPAVSIQHLSKILGQTFSSDRDLVIFDRLYFTHIFRTKSNLQTFKPIEDMLFQHETHLFFLKVAPDKIEERIFNALKGARAGTKWVDYVRTKGNDAQIVSYYRNQQEKLLTLLNDSEIPSTIYDVTDIDLSTVGKNIRQTLDLEHVDKLS